MAGTPVEMRVAKLAPLTPRDSDQRLVFGWASTVTDADGRPLIDHDDDVIPPLVLEEAVYDYVEESREAGREHGSIVGRLVESVILTAEKRSAMGLPPGPVAWWVGFRITDDATWARVKSGELRQFSIGGSAMVHPDMEVPDAYRP